MAGVTYSSAKFDLSAKLQRLFQKEPSWARHFAEAGEQNTSFYNHMNCIARAARRLDNVSSTGIVMTVQHAPWRSTISQISSAGVQSSPGLRCVIRSSALDGTRPTWTICKARFGLAKIVAAHAQIASSRSVWGLTTSSGRHPTTLVTAILPTNSTLVIRQYTASVGAVTAGSVAVSTGRCLVQVFAYGY